jgi:hypothetical protein
MLIAALLVALWSPSWGFFAVVWCQLINAVAIRWLGLMLLVA